MRARLINPPAASGVAMVREGRCMQRAGAWTAVWPPISLATIAAVLEAEGVECALDDCIIEGISWDESMIRVREFSPDLVVLNTATPSIVSDLSMAGRIKREVPGCKVLAIGIHVTALPEECLTIAPGLDAVVLGEPELTVLDAARALVDGIDLHNVAGLMARDGEGTKRGPQRQPADLDSLPFPAWHLVKRDLYRMPFSGNPFLMVGTSRGCPYHCIFCADPAYYGHRLRTKSPELIVAELQNNVESYGVRDFLFWSESFTLKPAWTREVLEKIIDSGLSIRFVVNSRSDQVDLDLLKLMKRAGCWMIGFGLESGSQKVLDLVDKRITVEQNRKAVEMARQAGLRVTAHMVLGYPGETEETMAETLEFADSLPIDFAQFYCAVPFPGSSLYEAARENGWIDGDCWERFEQNFSVVNTTALSAEKVMEWRKKAYRRFYSRPGRIARVLAKDVGLRGIPRFAKMMLDFREWI